MKITVTQSGLKAVTKEHGLTEYWSNRITYCLAPPGYPRVFCWVYRHEGRKLKQELRCHAVLCSKESIARRMAQDLSFRLAQALLEFKRDKLSKQNARLSLANAVYENPSLPRRKILLSTGSQNYRPPLERSKSAPKLMSIEESIEEEEEISDLRRSLKAKTRVSVPSFSEDVWGKNSVHIPGDFDPQEEFKGFDSSDDKEETVTLNPSVEKERKAQARMSWGGEDMSDTVFVTDLRSDPPSFIEDMSLSGKDARCVMTDCQKKLLQSLLDPGEDCLQASFTKLCTDLDYLEEESTPSLQSISSGSDTCRALRQCDLDSLSEEDSDESGFVEVGDDKIRDMPSHHLVKPCLLPSQSTSLHV